MQAVRTAAKDLVRTKQHIAKFYQMRSTLQGLNLKMQTMKTSNEIANAMGKMSKAMKQMNKKMNVPKMQELMYEFQKQEAQMEMGQEMMDDVLDDALDDPETAENEEAIVKQVLDEIGVDLTSSLKEAPVSEPVNAQAEADVSDLEKRLQNLRREG
jgi:charged multivesicular body protein 2A